MSKRRSRRGRNEGGVWQRKDGRWVGSVSAGVDRNGKRVRVSVYGKTKGEALAKLAEKRKSVIAGEIRPQSFTVAAFLDHWLETKAELRPQTRRKYQWAVGEIGTRLGHVRLSKLAPSQIQILYAQLAKEKSARLPSMVHEVLRAALNAAVRWKYLERNPLDVVPAPARPKRSMSVLTGEQTRRFLELAAADRFHALFVLAATTGARGGELVALQWRDLDLRRRRMSIRHTLTEINGRHELGEPKTEQSRRNVPLPAIAVDALLEHRRRMFAEGNAGAPVFCNTRGGWVRWSHMLRRHFKPLLERVEPGLGKLIRFHDLRHGYATALLEANVHPKKVATILGHANVQTTLKTYSHVTPAQLDEVADLADQLFRGEGVSKTKVEK